MPRWVSLSLPWLFLLVGLWASVLIINGTGPVACNELPQAFEHGMGTEVSGDGWGIYSRCSVTDRATGATVEETIVNWSGIVTSLAGCIGAWFLGAALGGLVDRRRAALSAAIALMISAFALVTSFV